jgi:hypothetical protein
LQTVREGETPGEAIRRGVAYYREEMAKLDDAYFGFKQGQAWAAQHPMEGEGEEYKPKLLTGDAHVPGERGGKP